MVIATRFAGRWPRLFALLAATSVLAFAQVAAPASAPSWIGRALTLHFRERRDLPAAPTRYVIDTGGGFTLDHTDHEALLKFDDSPEIWVLTRARGPRGDMIFTNDLGQPLLRTTKFGGVTVFTRRHPEGSAAALEGTSAPIRAFPVSALQLPQRLFVATVRSSRAAGRLIPVTTDVLQAASSTVIADASLIASEAVMEFSVTPGGRGILSRVARINIAPGRRVATACSAGVISITVVPKDGLLGRPSSAMVMLALAAARPAGASSGVEAVYFQASRP